MKPNLSGSRPPAIRDIQCENAYFYMVSVARHRRTQEALKTDMTTPLVTSAARYACSAILKLSDMNAYIRSIHRAHEHLLTSTSVEARRIKEEFGEITAAASCTLRNADQNLPFCFLFLLDDIAAKGAPEALQTPATTI